MKKTALDKIADTLPEKEKKKFLARLNKDPWRAYAMKRWAEEGEDAEKLIKL